MLFKKKKPKEDYFGLDRRLIISLFITIVFLIVYLLFDVTYELIVNKKEYGMYISNDKLECYLFCDKEDYYFSEGGMFGADTCTCRGDTK